MKIRTITPMKALVLVAALGLAACAAPDSQRGDMPDGLAPGGYLAERAAAYDRGSIILPPRQTLLESMKPVKRLRRRKDFGSRSPDFVDPTVSFSSPPTTGPAPTFTSPAPTAAPAGCCKADGSAWGGEGYVGRADGKGSITR